MTLYVTFNPLDGEIIFEKRPRDLERLLGKSHKELMATPQKYTEFFQGDTRSMELQRYVPMLMYPWSLIPDNPGRYGFHCLSRDKFDVETRTIDIDLFGGYLKGHSANVTAEVDLQESRKKIELQEKAIKRFKDMV